MTARSSKFSKLIDNSSSEDDENNNESSKLPTNTQLTQEQLDRIETNRKRALEIRKTKENVAKMAKIVLSNSEQKKMLDTGAGFYLDEEDLKEEKEKELNIRNEPDVPLPDEHLMCKRCNKTFPHSFLSINFDLHVCDTCKVLHADEYKLIAKTDAKNEFLLKDCDFDFRDPPLKYISKKNPHKNAWGEMKLYLRCQCEERALLVHEDKEKLEEKKEIKLHNLHKTRQKNYEKKLKTLRKEAINGKHKTIQFHQHEYGEEMHDEDNDIQYKICKTCSFRFEYEEL